MFKSLSQLDRRSYWMWAVPILAVHSLFWIATANQINVPPLGAVEILLILLLAVVLAGQFRDIGRPARIAASFLLITMIAIPLGAILYAITAGNRSVDTQRLMILVGQFTAPANLLLLIVAGSVPCKRAAADATPPR